MSESKCQMCHKIWRDGYVCTTCAKQATVDLTLMADLLDLADSKRARVGAIDYRMSGTAGPRETPLPFDPRVSKAVEPVRTGLCGTFQIVCEGRGWHLDDGTVTSAARCARWLCSHVDWLRGQPEGAEELAWFEQAVKSLQRLFDRPPERLFLGECGHVEQIPFAPCPEYVYVARARYLPATATCPRCRRELVVSQRRDYFIDRVKHYQATMRELTNLAPMLLTEPVSRRTLHEWTRHGLLRPVGARLEVDLSGRSRHTPTYRVGDLEPAADEWAKVLEDRRDRRRTRQRRRA